MLLALHAPESRAGGGIVPLRVRELRAHIAALGVDADVSTTDLPDPSGYDLVHVFNVWEPTPALAQLRHLRQFPVPIVFSPTYLELSEFAWAARALPQVFQLAGSIAERERYLAAVADGSLIADDVTRFGRNEIIPGYFAALREMVGLADHLIAFGAIEMEQLWAASVAPVPFTVVRDGVDAARFAAASPAAFAARYGLRDYVLSAGPIEPRRNQLLLVHALRDAEVPVVLIGANADPDYAALVRRHAGPNLIVVDDLPQESDLLASAYAGARVLALPSWCEGGPLGTLEAAAAGTPLVLADRGAAKEYLGELATYCDPGDVAAIRAAVLRAYQEPPNAARRQALRQCAAGYTWAGTARTTLKAYTQARIRHAHARPPARRPVAIATPPRKLEIGSGTDPQPGYEHLDTRPDLPCLEHVHDIQQRLPFDDHTFDEILSRSCLEHVSWREVTGILKDWCRVLKPGGTLRVYIPDFEYLCRMYLAGKTDEHLNPAYVAAAETLLGGYSPGAWAMIKMFGGQEYPANFHAAGYDLPTFTRILETAGFTQVTRVPPPHGLYVVARRA